MLTKNGRRRQPVTCGPLYLDALLKHAGGDLDKLKAFAAGFVNGQAEKVYLGACRAAMFRPSPQHVPLVSSLVLDAADRYGLMVRSFSGEIWLYRTAGDMDQLGTLAKDSPAWHRERGRLCGVPEDEIDERFHERKGYAEPCDEVKP